MKHRVAGRKLGRTSAHRLALLRNLSTALFQRERIKTTLHKAKELRPFAEKLVTLSKRETLHARRQVLRHIHDQEVVAKLFDTLSARFAQRPGGYTRIVKLGPRRGDGAEMALIELVGSEVAAGKRPTKGKGKAAARAAAATKADKPKAAAESAEKPEKKPSSPRKKAAPKKAKAEEPKKAAKKAAPKTAKKKTTKSGD
jgi:large subunit ribosomal protein L17